LTLEIIRTKLIKTIVIFTLFLPGFSFYSYHKRSDKLLPGNGGDLTIGSHIQAQRLNPPLKIDFLKITAYA